MPNVITIVFNCYGEDYHDNPKMFDAPERCHDANEALIDFLNDHHISYYEQWMDNSELIEMEREFAIAGIHEYGG